MASEKEKANSRQYYQDHKESYLSNAKLWRDTHKEKVKENAKKYYRDRREYFKEYYKTYREKCLLLTKRWKEEHPEEYKAQAIRHREKYCGRYKQRYLQLKIDVLTHYGNGICVCVKCGYNDIRALALDHINNNGAEERNHQHGYSSKNIGSTFYRRLRKENYPSGYQTLCYNCNQIKEIEHRKEKSLAKTSAG